MNIAYVVTHADCAATPRQRQTIEHFRRVRRHKFGMSLEYPVEIFGRNRTLSFSTTTLLSGLRVRSNAAASLLCSVLTSSFTCLRSRFQHQFLPFLFVSSSLRDNSQSDEFSPQQGLWAYARYPASLTRHRASSAPAPIGFPQPSYTGSFFDQSVSFSHFQLVSFHWLPSWFNWLPWSTLDLGWSWSSPATLP